MKKRDLVNLINRAKAAIETPEDLSKEEILYLVEDLVIVLESIK